MLTGDLAVEALMRVRKLLAVQIGLGVLNLLCRAANFSKILSASVHYEIQCTELTNERMNDPTYKYVYNFVCAFPAVWGRRRRLVCTLCVIFRLWRVTDTEPWVVWFMKAVGS